MKRFTSQAFSGLMLSLLRAIGGSNEEKMSVNMRTCGVIWRSYLRSINLSHRRAGMGNRRKKRK